jgi:hypothetical protein
MNPTRHTSFNTQTPQTELTLSWQASQFANIVSCGYLNESEFWLGNGSTKPAKALAHSVTNDNMSSRTKNSHLSHSTA